MSSGENGTPTEEQTPDLGGRSERKRGPDRRTEFIPVVVERRSGLDRRIEAEKRRMVDPVTCEKEYSEEEICFMNAIDQYKRANRRPFPTWSEVLEVVRSLGYRKVEAPVPLPGLPIKFPNRE